MIRFVLAALVALLPLAARAQTEQQALVDRATLTVQEMMNEYHGKDPQSLLQRARAVIVCPRVFKAGFILGGSGGDCVLAARDGAGSWSAPAFYTIGSGSIGLQAGIQDSEIMMMILTDKGLNAVLDNQFKFGADAGIAVATFGAGVGGATTPAFDADIVTFAKSRGLFGGVSLSGSLLSSRTAWNQAYYGQPLAARQIVVQMTANNPGADPFRMMLMRFGTPAVASAQMQAPMQPMQGQPQGQPMQQGQAMQPEPLSPPPHMAPVQQQSLPAPPRR